ncbi:2-succinyl-6-hydroxy-2,4-cyclohexadiene-1-carboxylate synthase [Exiguobacterium oxidotolerans]|uniref:2-succinyl-6-hydroxy-2, 4-cyclohexadiene-1-carboxylate synthase n=1 Tax=Exiguobacterium oxidotolerans TaxID=223958 RepID=UPI000494A5EF|nr:2-succinyl-6-hydroxy-2,4-cyclohexadiene-1-carboxylate synthase [Exiguobacterium oxidotolerans]
MKLRDHDYHLEVEGQGPPLLLLHGFTGSSRTWTMLSARLQETYTVYRIDLLGHGKTPPAAYQRMRLTEQVKDLQALLATRTEPWTVLGYSMGGRIALMLAACSTQVQQTIAVSTTPGLKTAHERRSRRVQDRLLQQMLLEDGLEAFVRHWEALPLFASQRQLPSFTQQQIRSERLSQSAEGLAASLAAQGTGNMPSLWKSIHDLPIEWIVGEYDEKFKQIAQQAADSKKIHQISHATHAPHIDQPEKFVTIVEKLLLT